MQVVQGLKVWCVDAGASRSQASCMHQVVCGSITKKVPALWDLVSLIDVVKTSFGLRGTVQLTATDGKEQCLICQHARWLAIPCPAHHKPQGYVEMKAMEQARSLLDKV